MSFEAEGRVGSNEEEKEEGERRGREGTGEVRERGISCTLRLLLPSCGIEERRKREKRV